MLFFECITFKKAMVEFYEIAARGDAIGALKSGAVFGALWAIGTAWSTAIRQISVMIFPSDTMDAVIAELLAATTTTVIGITIAMVAARKWGCCCVDEEAPPMRVRRTVNNTLARKP